MAGPSPPGDADTDNRISKERTGADRAAALYANDVTEPGGSFTLFRKVFLGRRRRAVEHGLVAAGADRHWPLACPPDGQRTLCMGVIRATTFLQEERWVALFALLHEEQCVSRIARQRRRTGAAGHGRQLRRDPALQLPVGSRDSCNHANLTHEQQVKIENGYLNCVRRGSDGEIKPRRQRRMNHFGDEYQEPFMSKTIHGKIHGSDQGHPHACKRKSGRLLWSWGDLNDNGLSSGTA